jgi:methionyl-tRNA formyltransferase
MTNGDQETGVTLHWVDERFDTGDLLLQEVLSIDPDETMTSLQYKSAQVGGEMLIRGVELIEGGNPPHIPQDNSQATYYSWPRPADLRHFRRRGGDYGTVFELMRYM